MRAKVAVVLFWFVAPAVFPTEVLARQTASLADMVVLHGKIYTVNARQPWAQALAIRDGKILSVGSEKEIEKYRGAATKVIDAQNHLVLPGFEDTHVHFTAGSFGLQQVKLDDADSIAEIQKRLKEYAEAHPGTSFIQGFGWMYPVFGKEALPDKRYLDEVLPDRPVLLSAYDGHTYWANSKALQMAGITKDTPDPLNGIIVHDRQTGEPTGALKESARQLVERVIPKPTRDETRAALLQGIHYANQLGLTRVHSAGGDDINLDLLDELRRQGQLTLRFYVALRTVLQPPTLTPETVEKLEKLRHTYADEWIDAGAVKFLGDGVIEAHTAAMLQPYSDDPSLIGKPNWSAEEFTRAVTELDRRGFQIFTHAIGDRTIQQTLDGYAAAHKANGTKDSRDRIEHIEDPSAAEIRRFGREGVIASMQPLHAYPNEDILQVWARNVGPERAQRAWPWHDIAAAGGHLAFGSDWPVVTLNPWPGVQNLLTRQTTEGTPPGGWIAKECITLEQAINGYTLGAAYAGRREKTEGSLEAGKVADLIVVSQDLFHTDPHRVGKTEVLVTIVGGKVVYESPDWSKQSTVKSGRRGSPTIRGAHPVAQAAATR